MPCLRRYSGLKDVDLVQRECYGRLRLFNLVALIESRGSKYTQQERGGSEATARRQIRFQKEVCKNRYQGIDTVVEGPTGLGICSTVREE